MSACGVKQSRVAPIDSPREANPLITFYPEEVRPEKDIPCFPGAYYRKIVSSKDVWVGIKGELILPQLQFDSLRMNSKKPRQFLDVSSVYLGGHMDGQETDIGLAWEIIRDEAGKVSEERLAFRPFLRRTAHRSGQQSIYINAPARKEYYWQPGDHIQMGVEVIADGILKFWVEGADKKFETTFECAGYTLAGIGEFKRVNAIDQVGNEGKAAQQTAANVTNATWKYTSLIRRINNKNIEVPFHEGRGTAMLCPDSKFFVIEGSDKNQQGGETISIYGNR